MSQEVVMDIIQNAVMTVIYTAAPPLIMGLGVGLTVSLFQAVTSIQEPTMSFVPKIVAVLFSIVIFGYFMLNMLLGFATNLFSSIPGFIDGIR